MGNTEIRGAEPAEVRAPTIGGWLEYWRRERTDHTAVAVHDGSNWSGITWREVHDDVMDLVAGLIASGLEMGDRVVIMAPTSYQWTRADLAVISAGAVTVPVYESSSPTQCRAILEQATPRFAFAASSQQAEVLREAHPNLTIWAFDGNGVEDLVGQANDESRAELRRRLADIDGQSVATIVFTSGTTGRPKGVPLTHYQLIWTARQTEHHLEGALQSGESTLLFLPLAHIFARVVVLAALESGVELAFGRSLEHVPEDLRSYRPTFLLAVPRTLDRVISGGRRKATGWKRPVFDWGMRTARAWSEASEAGRPGPLLRARHALAERLVLAQLRDGLGGRVRYAVSGGASLSPSLGHTIRGAGITVLEGYGLTETTAPVSAGTPSSNRIGTVGPPLPGISVRISDDGEIQVKGPSVMSGYLHDAGSDGDGEDDHDDFVDGWFRTGDQGSITDDGHLVIRTRTKEVIITDGGKSVAPNPLEDALVDDPAIAQAMVVGNDRPFIAALIALDEEDATEGDEQRREQVQRAVDRANEMVSSTESIRKFRIIHRPFTEEDEELTPTMKLRREKILEHFADDVEALYSRSSRS